MLHVEGAEGRLGARSVMPIGQSGGDLESPPSVSAQRRR